MSGEESKPNQPPATVPNPPARTSRTALPANTAPSSNSARSSSAAGEFRDRPPSAGEQAVPDDSSPWVDRVWCGDALEVLRLLPEALVDTVVTSPPYYQQRLYRDEQEIGRETNPEAYVLRLTEVFAECRRVLKPTGTLWLVLGDKYQNGQLLGMPWRVALGLQQNGWLLRSDIIWQKPNAMPSAAKSRPTSEHEYIFLMSRSSRYYYDADAIREPHVTFSPASKMAGGRKHFHRRRSTPEAGKNGGQRNLHDGRWDQAFHPLGRNKRTVWSIPLSKFREAHFAVFPEPLVETCLLASCPPGGVVLDPFLGSGTTAVVARRLGRRYLGIERVADYCHMACQRLGQAFSQGPNS